MRNYKFWGVRKYSVTCLKEDIISISNSYQFLWHDQCWWLWQVWQHTCVKNLIRFWHSFLSTVCHTCAKTSIDIYGNGVPFMLENELKRNWYFWIFSKFACLLDLEIHSLSDLILCLILKLISFLISFLCLILSWFSFWCYFSACLKTNSLWFYFSARSWKEVWWNEMEIKIYQSVKWRNAVEGSFNCSQGFKINIRFPSISVLLSFAARGVPKN